MEWYYAEGNERRGPVDDAQFKQLAATGKIGPDTLVWKAGLPAWQPFRTLTSAEPPPVPLRDGWQRCIILGREFEAKQTPEAKFATALDRLQPMLLNANTEGAAWRKHGVKLAQVRAKNAYMADGSAALWDYAAQMIEEAAAVGHLEK
jgi:hypothetical protein